MSFRWLTMLHFLPAATSPTSTPGGMKNDKARERKVKWNEEIKR